MKKTVMLLTLVLCLALCPVFPALSEERAEEPALESEGFRYRLLEDGTAEILEYVGKELQLVLPEALDGHPITAIGEEAFYDFRYSMEDLHIPASVTHIGSNAFSMTDLEEIEIPAGVVSMGENPFGYCESLKTITVAEGNPVFYAENGVLFCREDHSLVCFPNLMADPEEGEYETYTVPAGTEIIRGDAFGGVEGLSGIILPDSLRVIGSQAFGFCWALDSISIPDSVTEIGDAAFDTCKYLVSAVLPAGLKRIPSMLFYECESLNAVDIPETVTEIGSSAFDFCSSLEQSRIPDGVTVIETAVFEGCSSLTSIEIPDSVIEIGAFAFSGCFALTDIRIPATVTKIGEYAFANCSSLKELVISDSVQFIGEQAFASCPDDLIIICGEDSCAKTYCEQNGIDFWVE